jgi:hypothetical protein
MKTILGLGGPERVDFEAVSRTAADIRQRLLQTALEIADLARKIDQRSAEVLAEAEQAAGEGRTFPDLPTPSPPRSHLLRIDAGECIRALLRRRQRSRAAAPEDAPRKVSRGRAPPLLSACPI